LFGESEAEVNNFFTAKEAFLQINLDVVLDQAIGSDISIKSLKHKT
jgi:hypothetical protein